MADRGYYILSPGQVPVEMQIALFMEAREIVGAVGSGMLNVIFSRKKPLVVGLIHNLLPDRVLSDLTAAVDMDLSYIVGRSSSSDHDSNRSSWNSSWTVDVPKVLSSISRLTEGSHRLASG
jgi:capsular polysaccharide biosynthesis protein